MKTKRVSLIYTITPDEVFSPAPKSLARKDAFIKQVQKTVPSVQEPKQIKVTYEVFNPEVDKLRAFFHTCVKYYAIQNMDLFDRLPTTKEFKAYREEILDELLGYNFQTTNKILRMRPSTSSYKDTEPWLELLTNLEESLFESAGYKFPDSKEFWELEARYGYTKANQMSLNKLQESIKRKLT